MLIEIEDEVVIDYEQGGEDLINYFELGSNFEGLAIIADLDGSYVWIEGYDVAIDRNLVLFNLTKAVDYE